MSGYPIEPISVQPVHQTPNQYCTVQVTNPTTSTINLHIGSIPAASMQGQSTSGIPGSSKFTFNIPNFSRKSARQLLLEVFTVGGCRWRLVVVGRERNQNDNVDYFSIYLRVSVVGRISSVWGREVVFSLALVNHLHKSASITKERQAVFNAKSNVHGFKFIPLSKIQDRAEGYLMNDNLTIEAVVAIVKKPVHVTLEPSNHSNGSSESDSVTTDQQGNVPVTEGTTIHSGDEAVVQTACKRLLTELSSRRKKHKPLFSNEILGSSQAPDSAADFQQQQKEALRVYFDMPFEAMQQANCFLKIEECLQELVQHTNDRQERTVFEDIMTRLANFKRSIDNAKKIAETTEARKSSLAGKSADLDSKLEQRQKELSSLESDFSMLSGEEAKLRAEIDRVIARKKSVSVKLERANAETRKEIEEWRSLESEMKKVDAEWVGAKEKLASANVHWDILREDLGF